MQIILRHVIFFYSVDTQNIKKYFPFIFLFVIISTLFGASQVVQLVKNLLANAGYIRDVSSIPMSGRSPGEGNGNPLQFLAWKIPWTEGPGGLQSTGLQRVGHNWSDWACPHTPGIYHQEPAMLNILLRPLVPLLRNPEWFRVYVIVSSYKNVGKSTLSFEVPLNWLL